MKSPTPIQWLIGNPVVSLAMMLVAIVAVIGGLAGQIHWFMVILAIALGLSAARASERVNAYQRWQREWEGMGGQAGPRGRTLFTGWRKGLAVICWLFGAWWALQGSGGDPVLQLAIVLFWIGTAVIVAVPIWRVIRRKGPARAGTASVAVTLSIPRQSPSIEQAYRAVGSIVGQSAR